jgi:hypothetical protein
MLFYAISYLLMMIDDIGKEAYILNEGEILTQQPIKAGRNSWRLFLVGGFLQRCQAASPSALIIIL